MNQKLKILLERVAIGVIFLGLIFLCQPFYLPLYRIGFQVLLFATLAFIVVSHFKTEED